jgi:type III restriction enzyme
MVQENSMLTYDAENPGKTIITELLKRPEVDYDRCSELLFKLINSFLGYIASSNDEKSVKNIVMFNKKDIAEKIYRQMMNHFECTTPNLVEEVVDVQMNILPQNYTIKGQKYIKNILNPNDEDLNIANVIYEGFTKALHPQYKFDSEPERIFAIVCESDNKVLKWLRPAPKQFNITYHHGKKYEPDFVIETKDSIYLVEVKADNQMEQNDVVAKKDSAVKYCKIATEYNKSKGGKPWCYLLIPSSDIKANRTLEYYSVKYLYTE